MTLRYQLRETLTVLDFETYPDEIVTAVRDLLAAAIKQTGADDLDWTTFSVSIYSELDGAFNVVEVEIEERDDEEEEP